MKKIILLLIGLVGFMPIVYANKIYTKVSDNEFKVTESTTIEQTYNLRKLESQRATVIDLITAYQTKLAELDVLIVEAKKLEVVG